MDFMTTGSHLSQWQIHISCLDRWVKSHRVWLPPGLTTCKHGKTKPRNCQDKTVYWYQNRNSHFPWGSKGDRSRQHPFPHGNLDKHTQEDLQLVMYRCLSLLQENPVANVNPYTRCEQQACLRQHMNPYISHLNTRWRRFKFPAACPGCSRGQFHQGIKTILDRQSWQRWQVQFIQDDRSTKKCPPFAPAD